MAKKKNNKIGLKVGLPLLGVLLLVGIFFIVQQTAFDRAPDCTFTENETTCLYEVTLPENREATSYVFDLTYGRKAAAAYTGETVVNHLHTASTREENRDSTERYTWYLYGAPENWGEAAEVKLSAAVTAHVVCRSEGDDVDVDTVAYAITQPWGNSISVKREDDCDRSPSTCLIEEDSDDGDTYTSVKNVFSLGRLEHLSCHTSRSEADRGDVEDLTETRTLTGIVGEANLLTDIKQQKFLVGNVIDIDDEGGSGSANAPVMTMSYKPAKYPTNLKYYVGSQYIEELAGEQRGNGTTLDVADQVNAACNRDKSVAECTFTLKLTSTEPGLIWIEPTRTLKLAEPSDDPGDDGTDEPSDDAGDDSSGEGLSTTFWVVTVGLGLLVIIIVAIVMSAKKSKKGRGKK